MALTRKQFTAQELNERYQGPGRFIVNKYPAACKCGDITHHVGWVKRDEVVYWVKGEGIYHWECAIKAHKVKDLKAPCAECGNGAGNGHTLFCSVNGGIGGAAYRAMTQEEKRAYSAQRRLSLGLDKV